MYELPVDTTNTNNSSSSNSSNSSSSSSSDGDATDIDVDSSPSYKKQRIDTDPNPNTNPNNNPNTNEPGTESSQPGSALCAESGLVNIPWRVRLLSLASNSLCFPCLAVKPVNNSKTCTVHCSQSCPSVTHHITSHHSTGSSCANSATRMASSTLSPPDNPLAVTPLTPSKNKFSITWNDLHAVVISNICFVTYIAMGYFVSAIGRHVSPSYMPLTNASHSPTPTLIDWTGLDLTCLSLCMIIKFRCSHS